MAEHKERPVAPRLGEVLGGSYRLTRELGRGAMGAVYLAEDLALERQVAVKVLLPEHAVHQGQATLFRREARLLAAVQHENVVRVHALGEHGGAPYLVMEYITGPTLASYLVRMIRTQDIVPLDMLGLTEDKDFRWMSGQWKRLVLVRPSGKGRAEAVHRRYFELAVMHAVKDDLKSGDLFIKYGERYDDYREQLVDDETFEREVGDYGQVTGIETAGNRIVAIEVGGERLPVQNLVWTGPMNEITRLLGIAGLDLEYLSTIFYNLELKRPDKLDFQWTYYGGDEIFSRVTTPSAFAKTTLPAGKGALCVEMTCREGDERWQNPERYTEAIIKDLVRTRTIDSASDVERVHVADADLAACLKNELEGCLTLYEKSKAARGALDRVAKRHRRHAARRDGDGAPAAARRVLRGAPHLAEEGAAPRAGEAGLHQRGGRALLRARRRRGRERVAPDARRHRHAPRPRQGRAARQGLRRRRVRDRRGPLDLRQGRRLRSAAQARHPQVHQHARRAEHR